MVSFADLLATFDPDPKKRGPQFERFVKWFLKNDPEWATQVDEVWLWKDYPGRWGRDCGIDLVFRDKTGSVWAVQTKCYSPSYEITKADVDKFLSESNRKQINHRLLIATTDGIGANARQVLGAQEKSVVRYHLADFENAAVDYPDSIERLALGKRKPPPEPHLHQIEAVENVISGFGAAARGQLVMACGTGKTFVCLWVKERLKAKKTLVLVPSLGLLSQTLNEWTYAARDKFDALCVCSDQTVNKREEDEAISLVSDLPFPVSSDVKEIAKFLAQDSDQVVFSTYQSSPLIAQAQRNNEVPHFDLVIADEAHRVAGKSDSVFGAILDERLIKSEKRLFATATPRVYKRGLKKAAAEVGVEVVDMSDEKSFGKRFHTLTFGEAIQRSLLTDYRVVIVGVDDGRIKEWIENRRLVATGTGLATDAKSLAGQVGLVKAIKDWNLQTLISFHGRVKRAREFSEDITQVGEWLDADHRPSSNLWAEHVSGEMPTISRRQKLKRLKNVGRNEIGLLSNARCLSEGVDVPSLDGVAFIDPRSSEIDIIQSVGRAIRLSENKTLGTIVIPVFIEQTENAEEALEASEFKPIWDVLEALKSHDDRLSDELDQLRIELGAKRKRYVGANDLTKIVFDLPTSVNEDFAQSLRAHLVERTTESWMFWYGLLKDYKMRNGDCRVPFGYIKDGYRLGQWVQVQRRADNSRWITDQRRRLLDQIGYDWTPVDSYWQEGFEHLRIFKQREGHCHVPRFHVEGGFKLGTWVNSQRNRRANGNISSDQLKLLDESGFVWAAKEVAWQEGFEHLKIFKQRENHCRVPRFHVEGKFKLGIWVSTQRQRHNGRVLSNKERALLNEIGFFWSVQDDRLGWEGAFALLKQYKLREGDCDVPSKHVENGYKLGRWVIIQRVQKDTMSTYRRKCLEDIGFAWSADKSWDNGYSALKAFRAREGHCRVPQNHVEGACRLGAWVNWQRFRRDRLSAEQIEKLNNLAFVWNIRDEQWEKGFVALTNFTKRGGCSRVPKDYIEEGYKLGEWVSRQRAAKDKMDPDRRQRLEALPGWVWKVEK